MGRDTWWRLVGVKAGSEQGQTGSAPDPTLVPREVYPTSGTSGNRPGPLPTLIFCDLRASLAEAQSFGTGTSLTGVTVAVQYLNPGHRNLWIAFTSAASTI